MLGKRDPIYYGRLSLEQINNLLSKQGKILGVTLDFFQSNHEGELIDFLQTNSSKVKGILINPGALTHYGYSLRDALVDCHLPVVSVHLSDIKNRETFRITDILEDIVLKNFSGEKEESYLKGLKFLIKNIKK